MLSEFGICITYIQLRRHTGLGHKVLLLPFFNLDWALNRSFLHQCISYSTRLEAALKVLLFDQRSSFLFAPFNKYLVPALCQSLWLGHVRLPNYGSNNATLFSGGEKNREGHVEGKEEEERGKLLCRELYRVMKSVVALGAWFSPGNPDHHPHLGCKVFESVSSATICCFSLHSQIKSHLG